MNFLFCHVKVSHTLLSLVTDLQSVKLVFELGLIVNELLVELLLILFHLVFCHLYLVKNLSWP